MDNTVKAWLELTGSYINENMELSESNLEEFRDLLRFHEQRYYVQNDPLIPDFDYDQLFTKLKEFETRNPDLIEPDSPTQRVGADLTKDFPTAEHTLPMLSLDNSYNEEDLIHWDNRVKGFLGDEPVEYTVEPKFDGSSIALIYENDRLVRGTTRGNGTAGEDVTTNVKVINSIPLKALFSNHKVTKAELRGEILIDKEIFKKINEKRIEEGLPVLANPRNSAAGSMRIQDPREVAKRGLDAYIYQMAYAVDSQGNNLIPNIKNHYNNMQIVQDLGFRSPLNEMKVYSGIGEVLDYCREWEEKRGSFPFEIDGMVIKVNDYHQQELCGATSHHPRWAIAYKFKAQQATTVLESIEYQVGRTGAVTPVAKIKPVSVGGVTISSVSLFNEEVIVEKDLMIGDTIVVERAGDVIPYIVKSIADDRKGYEETIVFPRNCPSCQTELVKPEEEAVWRCVNINCPAQSVERIIHFVSKNAMDIDGLGEKLVRRFYEEERIGSILDIYNLDFDEISGLEGLGEKSANKLRDSIEDSKKRPLERLIFGLGIRYAGQTTSKILAKQVESLIEFKEWTEEELIDLPDVGPKVAESIFEFFSNEKNIALIADLESKGLNVFKGESTQASNLLEGKSYLFTGTLETLKREQAKQLVEDNGGKLISSVSKNLDVLVIGKSPGSKFTKAEKLGTVEIISEEKFLDRISKS